MGEKKAFLGGFFSSVTFLLRIKLPGLLKLLAMDISPSTGFSPLQKVLFA